MINIQITSNVQLLKVSIMIQPHIRIRYINPSLLRTPKRICHCHLKILVYLIQLLSHLLQLRKIKCYIKCLDTCSQKILDNITFSLILSYYHFLVLFHSFLLAFHYFNISNRGGWGGRGVDLVIVSSCWLLYWILHSLITVFLFHSCLPRILTKLRIHGLKLKLSKQNIALNP